MARRVFWAWIGWSLLALFATGLVMGVAMLLGEEGAVGLAAATLFLSFVVAGLFRGLAERRVWRTHVPGLRVRHWVLATVAGLVAGLAASPLPFELALPITSALPLIAQSFALPTGSSRREWLRAAAITAALSLAVIWLPELVAAGLLVLIGLLVPAVAAGRIAQRLAPTVSPPPLPPSYKPLFE